MMNIKGSTYDLKNVVAIQHACYPTKQWKDLNWFKDFLENGGDCIITFCAPGVEHGYLLYKEDEFTITIHDFCIKPRFQHQGEAVELLDVFFSKDLKKEHRVLLPDEKALQFWSHCYVMDKAEGSDLLYVFRKSKWCMVY